MSEIDVASAAVEDTCRIARLLAESAAAGDCITLSGEVGAGKTTFAQGFIGALLETPENITSPTFTLVQHYKGKRGLPILHADLYRLKSVVELVEIGLEEALESHITLIEWPEIAQSVLPEDALHIQMGYISENRRNIVLRSNATRWQSFFQQVKQ